MLSFMRDQGLANLGAKEPDAVQKPGGDNEEQSQEQEYVTVAAQSSSVRKSTTVLAVLFIIGMLCLWFMIRKSAPKSASAEQIDTEQAKVEAAIAHITGVKSEMNDRMDEIVNKFYQFSEVPQVEVNQLVKNPFELEMFLASLRNKLDGEEGNLQIDVGRLMREEAKNLQLFSIMESGRKKCCMINSKVLYDGDSIGDFKVREIGDSYVTLRWIPKVDSSVLGAGAKGLETTLKLSE